MQIFYELKKKKNCWKVCWNDHSSQQYLYMYYNLDASSHHLLYDRLFSLWLEKKKGKAILAGSSCCIPSLPVAVWMHTAVFRFLCGVWMSRRTGPVQVHSPGTSLDCQIFIEVFTQSHLKNPNQKHWGVTQRADTVESYRKESRESLFLATAKKRKLIA